MKSPSLYQATAGAGLPVAVHVKTTCDERFVNEGRFNLYQGKKGRDFLFQLVEGSPVQMLGHPPWLEQLSSSVGGTSGGRSPTILKEENKIRRRSKTENHELFRKKKKY